MKAKKTWKEKLLDDKGMPKIQKVTGKLSKRWGTGTFVIPAPREVDAIMRRVPEGKLITINVIRAKLAKKHKTNFACPICTGIFASIAARAADEEMAAGNGNVTPFWRTLKEKGELNEKYPGGTEYQTVRLEAEGHTVVKKGKRSFVADFERRLVRT
jgi:alkylated DNA nucleotide flippase Atl1